MNKEQKRFPDRISIISEITDTKRKILYKLQEADKLDAEADLMRGCPELVCDLEFHRSRARKLRKQADSMNHGRLQALQNALAEFENEVLPGVIQDNAVVLKAQL